MRKVIIGAALVVFLISSHVGAKTSSTETVQDLLAVCKDLKRNPDGMYCLGIANGVMITLMAINAENNKMGACFPPRKTTNGQIIQAFINWSERNPKNWGLPAGLGMVFSTMEMWPCPK